MNAILKATVFILVLSIWIEAARPAAAERLPEFTHTRQESWIGTTPKQTVDYQGTVLLIDFWTFSCWNCYRSFPWLNSLEAKLSAKPFAVLGVHTPEFPHERARAEVEKKIQQFHLKHPVMLDNDHSYWNAIGNKAWPAFYIVDRVGNIRARFVGETHDGSDQARAIEALIESLLSEK